MQSGHVQCLVLCCPRSERCAELRPFRAPPHPCRTYPSGWPGNTTPACVEPPVMRSSARQSRQEPSVSPFAFRGGSRGGDRMAYHLERRPSFRVWKLELGAYSAACLAPAFGVSRGGLERRTVVRAGSGTAFQAPAFRRSPHPFGALHRECPRTPPPPAPSGRGSGRHRRGGVRHSGWRQPGSPDGAASRDDPLV